MVHVLFDPRLEEYDTDSSFVQGGMGIEGLGAISGGSIADPPLTYPFFKGSRPYQRGWGIQNGAGVSDVLRGLWRFFRPLLRRVGTTVSAEALNTGKRVLDKVVNEGAPLKETLVSEGKRGIDSLLQQGGLPSQFGTGKHRQGRRRRQPHNSALHSHQTYIGRRRADAAKRGPPRKYSRADTFGLF